MFKAFRNKVFAIYFTSILVLLVSLLSFIYIRSENEMENSINQRLSENRNGIGNVSQTLRPFDNQAPVATDSSINFELDNNPEITISKDDNFELKIKEYLGEDVTIDYKEGLIFDEDQTYAFGYLKNSYKVVNITYDLHYLNTLRTTLLTLGIIVIIIFGVLGYILITNLVKPLERSYQIQNRFVSDASHELKTPLAIIKSCMQLIAKGDDDSENLIKYVSVETDRMIRLTNSLLQLTETEHGNYPSINVSNNLELAMSAIEVSLFEKKIHLDSQIEEDIYAKVASDDLSQLLHILIDNAVKYNDDRLSIRIRLYTKNRNLVFKVSNSSDYVSSEHLSHIFDRFYRIDSSRTEKGFGLGLSLAKHITNNYDGEIKADYSAGYFAVTIKLPL